MSKSGKTPDTPKELLTELETLQRVLDGAIDTDKNLPVLDPIDDIPILDDLFSEETLDPVQQNQDNIKKREASSKQETILKAVPAPEGTSRPKHMPDTKQDNPFLPQSILQRLAHEREAAQISAAQAQQTIQKIVDSRHQTNEPSIDEELLSALISATQTDQKSIQLGDRQKAHLIDEVVNEVLPDVEKRLRDKIAKILG